MESSHDPTADFVPLSRESVELYQQFWAQMGVATTTVPPMDFLGLKQGAIEWGERLNLPAGILAKFRQRISAAERDGDVFALMGEFERLASAPTKARAAGIIGDAAPDSATARAGGNRRSRASKQAQALALLTDHPSWTNKQIAAAVRVHPKSFSRWANFNRARRLLQEKGCLPRGYRDKESGRLEAYVEDSDDDER